MKQRLKEILPNQDPALEQLNQTIRASNEVFDTLENAYIETETIHADGTPTSEFTIDLVNKRTDIYLQIPKGDVTQIIPVQGNVTILPQGARFGDLIVNTSNVSITVLSTTLLPSHICKITSTTPFQVTTDLGSFLFVSNAIIRTAQEWDTLNPILDKGIWGYSDNPDGSMDAKVGNEFNTWRALPTLFTIYRTPVLPAPTNIRIDVNTKVMSWGAVENSIGYTIEADGIVWRTDITNTSYLLSELTGTHLLRLKALGDKDNWKDSDWSIYVVYQSDTPQLETPQNFAIDETAKKATWDNVPNALGYEIQFNSDTPIWLGEVNSYDLSSLKTGTYLIRIRALSDGIAYRHSDWTAQILYTVYVPSFADATWEQINELAVSGTIKNHYNVGDTKVYTIGAQNITFVIAGFDHDTRTSGGLAAVTIFAKTQWSTSYSMWIDTTTDTVSSWQYSNIRGNLMGSMLTSIPYILKNLFVSVQKPTIYYTSDTAHINGPINQLTETIFCPSLAELGLANYGTTSQGLRGEGKQYAYFDSQSARTSVGSKLAHWTRSVDSTGALSDQRWSVGWANGSGYTNINRTQNSAYPIFWGFCLG